MNNGINIDEEDLVPLHLALKTLTDMGVDAGSIEEFIEQPGTALEAPAVEVQCRSQDLFFRLSYSGFGGHTTLESCVRFFDDSLAIKMGDPEDVKVREFISWLKKNSPTKIAIQRTYGRLTFESEDEDVPEYPTREAIGGSVIVYVPLLMLQMEAHSPYIASQIRGDSYSQAVDRYFHSDAFRDTQLLRLPEVIPAVLAFMHEALVEVGVGVATSREFSQSHDDEIGTSRFEGA